MNTTCHFPMIVSQLSVKMDSNLKKKKKIPEESDKGKENDEEQNSSKKTVHTKTHPNTL